MTSASAKLHTELESMHQKTDPTLQDAHFNELKGIRKQLYSAADYFEASYINDKREKLVMERLKDYTLKALVNTVDHLGSMAYNINTNFVYHMNCNIGAEITQLDLRLCCLQQRVRTCRDFAALRGVSQQSLATDSPRHHKRYTCLAENRFQQHHESRNCSASPRLNHRLNNPTRSPASFIWEEYFVSQSPDLPLSLGPTPTYPLTTSWKSGSSSEASPNVHHHNLIPALPHSGSVLIMRPTSPTNCYPIKRHSRQPRKTTSLPVERGTSWEEEAYDHHSGKGKRLLKAMLSLRIKSSKRDDTCY